MNTSSGGTIKIKNGRGKKLTFIDEEGNTTTEKYTRTTTLAKAYVENITDSYWFTKDNNYNAGNFDMIDNIQLNSIIQSDNNNSLGKISDLKIDYFVPVQDELFEPNTVGNSSYKSRI